MRSQKSKVPPSPRLRRAGKSQKLSIDNVKHIAGLANLGLSEKEIGNYRRWLSETLDYVQILDSLETKDVAPTAQVTGLENVFRDDERGEKALNQKEALSNTSMKERGFFKIKKIL